jgi:type IV pilus assembly protein PilQ
MTVLQRTGRAVCALMVLFSMASCTSFDNRDASDADQEMEFEPVASTTPDVATDAAGALDNDVSLTDIRYVSRKAGGTVVIEANSPLTFRTRENKETNQLVVDIPNSRLPDRLKRPYITKDFNQQISSINAYQDSGSTTARVVIQFRTPTRATVTQSGKRLLVFPVGPAVANGQDRTLDDTAEIDNLARVAAVEGSSSDPRILPQSSTELTDASRFYGRPISIEVRDTSVRDVIQLIAEQSGANIVLASGVEGNISLKLKQIPWDQTLMIVMKSQGLGYVRQGSVLRIAPLKTLKDENDAARQILEAQRAAEPLKVKIVPVSYAKVGELVDQVKPFLTEKRGAVVADPRTSSLIITDTPEIIERISNLVNSLDTPPLQVLIEGKVVEAREGFTRRFGVNWGFSGQQTALGGGRSIQSNNLQIAGANVASPNINYNIRLGTFDIFGDLDANLALAESENLAKVVSSPRVSAVNNSPATISQVVNSFVAKQTVVGGTLTNTYEKLETKLALAVTPQITGEGNIIMDLEIQRDFNSDVQPVGGAPAPIESRQAKTKIMVRNGETAVVGGIYQSDVIESETGVPWLRSIPVVGWLFKSRTFQNTKNELILFLTPRIITTDAGTGKEGSL